MSVNPEMSNPSLSETERQLHSAASLVRDSHKLDADARSAIADLLDELSRALHVSTTPPEEIARLASGAANLVDSLHQDHDPGLFNAARARMEEFASQAESRAPTAVGLTRRLIDALANLGI